MMSKNTSFSFSNLCGHAYEAGDVLFDVHSPNTGTSRSKSLLSPVGNRLIRFDLDHATSSALPFETVGKIRRLATTKSLLVVVDDIGRGVVFNSRTGATLHRINFGEHVHALRFSADETMLLVCCGRKSEIWSTPPLEKVFSPLVRLKTFTGHSDDVTCAQWFGHSNLAFVTGSKDATLMIHRVLTPTATPTTAEEHADSPSPFHTTSLFAHKTPLVGVFPSRETDQEPCICSISRDGSLYIWRYKSTTNGDDDHDNKRVVKRSRAMSSSSQKSWVLVSKHYTQQSHARVTAAQATKDLLLLGFDDGVFSLLEIPSGQKLQTLSASKFAIETCDISPDGTWVALGSPTMGQLIVWEWTTETFVLKQQGHYYSLNCVAFSRDGRVMATGGDDGRVKIWNATSGISFATFTEHDGPITGLQFTNTDAVVSCSLDGSVRAFDLVRLRNFRTLLPPEPTQLTCVAMDEEIVVSGGFDPCQIFVWNLRTSELLDVLSGHEGPISALDFSSAAPLIASASWDGTVRVWEPYKSTKPLETLMVGSDVLSVCFRPDGKQLCASSLNGQITFWDVEEGRQTGFVDAKRDVTDDAHDKISRCFTTVCYSANGTRILTGGNSRWVCIYDVSRELLLKKFQLTHEQRNNDGMNEDDDDEEARRRRWREDGLPGVRRGHDASKRYGLRPQMRVSSVKFNPSGTMFGVASSHGLLMYSSDDSLSFQPVDLMIDATPAAARELAIQGDYSRALLVALVLGEEQLVTDMICVVPLDQIQFVSGNVPDVHLEMLLMMLSRLLEQDVRLEYALVWAFCCLSMHHDALMHAPEHKLLPALRALQRAVNSQQKRLGELCEGNLFDGMVMVGKYA